MTAAEPTTGFAHFRIEAAGFVDLARQISIEDKEGWSRAADLIHNGLHGISWDDTYAILEGGRTLVGDEHGMEMADEDPAEAQAHRRGAHWLWAGVVKVGGRWWEPYRYVAAYGKRDAMWALTGSDGPGSVTITVGRESTWTSRRALYYADNPATDRAETMDLPEHPMVDVLWRPSPPPPPWHAAHQPSALTGDSALFRAALAEYLAAHKRLDRAECMESEDRRMLARASAALTPPERDANGVPPVIPRDPRAIATVAADIRRREERAARLRDEDREDEEREAARLADLEVDRARITEQAAADGYLDLVVGDATYRVPRAPFLHWAIGSGMHDRYSRLQALAPAWSPVSESGYRLYGDDPMHTDWIVGAGLDPLAPEAGFGKPIHDAACRLASDERERLTGNAAALLWGSGSGAGPAVHGVPEQEAPAGSVVVIPNAGPDYVVPALSVGPTGLVVTEAGGALAHLGQIAMERGINLVRLADARIRIPDGIRVWWSIADGECSIHVSDPEPT